MAQFQQYASVANQNHCQFEVSAMAVISHKLPIQPPEILVYEPDSRRRVKRLSFKQYPEAEIASRSGDTHEFQKPKVLPTK